MKKLMMAAAMLGAFAAMADATQPELEEVSDASNWRLMVGGFGRGNLRTKMAGAKADFDQVYGAELDLQYNAWENEDFALWVGVGGTFCPRQRIYKRGFASSDHESEVSEDGFTTYTYDYSDSGATKVDLSYGELRLMLTPEWKATSRLSLGARLGVAFDWMQAKFTGDSTWQWNSSFAFDIPGIGHDEDLDSDSGSYSDSEKVTEFAAQGIVGIQGTYMFTDTFGLYANCDWRIGGKTDFKKGGETYASVDMSGWYAGFGVVFSF